MEENNKEDSKHYCILEVDFCSKNNIAEQMRGIENGDGMQFYLRPYGKDDI